MLDVEELNSYSKKIYGLVEKYYPDWIGLIKETEHEKGAFKISVSAPAGIPLEICTCNNEITVSFGKYHSHFDKWLGVSQSVYEEAKLFIDGLISGRIIIASVFENSKWCYSTIVSSSDLEQFAAKFKGTNREFQISRWEK